MSNIKAFFCTTCYSKKMSAGGRDSSVSVPKCLTGAKLSGQFRHQSDGAELGSIETLHRTNWTNRPQILSIHGQKLNH